MSGSAVDELARQLRADYDAAPRGRQAASIHLFGIRHAQALRGVSKSAVAERAGLPKSYGTEINKGVQLSEYVAITKPLV
ncbi:HTH-like domain-containing protein [Sphingomonas adhaesiva]|uniref:HTH-like domain-containing protein n=1 Tax=Sphingomonas adhaesiva TaxID=28212 RepID=UPI002FF81E65